MKFITYPELADRVGVLVKSVHRWTIRHRGVFPEAQACPTCGYEPVVDRADVDAWLRDTGRMP